jgi:sorbitol/mannitol transport system permease protein
MTPRDEPTPARRFLALPAVLYLVVLTQIPLALTLFYSVQRWNLLRPEGRSFAGLRSYAAVLHDPAFWPVLRTTVVLTTSVVALTFALGLGLALLFHREFPGRGLARTLVITPFLLMPTVSAVLWKNVLLDPTFGLVSVASVALGLGAVDPLTHHPLASVVAIMVWEWTPFMMLILLAGLQSLPQEQVEAAQIDGARPVTTFRFIILPHLRRYAEIAVLLEVLFVLSLFAEIFVATSGGPGIATTNLTYQIFREAFERWNIGRASALGVVAILFANVVLLLFVRVLRHGSTESPA